MPCNKSGLKQNPFDSQFTIVTVDLIDTIHGIFPKKNQENTFECKKQQKTEVPNISNHEWVNNVH